MQAIQIYLREKLELDEFVKKCRIKSEIVQQSKIRDCLIALIEFIEVIRRRRYDNPKEDDNTYI